RGGPAVEEHRTDHGLDGVGEHGRAMRAARAQLAAAEQQMLVDTDFPADRGKRRLIDERCAGAAQVPFVVVGAHRIEPLGNREIEERVAEELETLVVLLRRAAMRQRELEQLRIFETMLQMSLGPTGPSGHRLISTFLSNVTRNQISAMYGVRLSYWMLTS